MQTMVIQPDLIGFLPVTKDPIWNDSTKSMELELNYQSEADLKSPLKDRLKWSPLYGSKLKKNVNTKTSFFQK